jgi:hypothetical protein
MKTDTATKAACAGPAQSEVEVCFDSSGMERSLKAREPNGISAQFEFSIKST